MSAFFDSVTSFFSIFLNMLNNTFGNLIRAITLIGDAFEGLVRLSSHLPSVIGISFSIFILVVIINYFLGR